MLLMAAMPTVVLCSDDRAHSVFELTSKQFDFLGSRASRLLSWWVAAHLGLIECYGEGQFRLSSLGRRALRAQ